MQSSAENATHARKVLAAAEDIVEQRIRPTLGKPIPSEQHAICVSMPEWRDVVDYEEGSHRIQQALACGYPRFFIHPLVKQLILQTERRFAKPGEFCALYPSRRSAEDARRYIVRSSGVSGRLEAIGFQQLHTLVLSPAAACAAKEYWQHTGRIVSSRTASKALKISSMRDDLFVAELSAKASIKKRLADLYRVDASEVFLFPTGMSAVYEALLAVQSRTREARCVQVGFPYIDTLKLLQKFGAGARGFLNLDESTLGKVERVVISEPIAGVFAEVPNNPLLKTPPIVELSRILREKRIPLVVDDSIASPYNVELLPYADIIVSSLTKFFSGAGNCMAGALVLNPQSPLYEELRETIDVNYEDLLFAEDAIVLERNSRDFVARICKVNENARVLTDLLSNHPLVGKVFYPGVQSSPHFEAIRRPTGGYGGLFSLLLKNPQETSQRFYDALSVAKGPGFGTSFTLACPYTLLAHYRELAWAKRFGVSRYLVRVSVGIESTSTIEAAFRDALSGLGK